MREIFAWKNPSEGYFQLASYQSLWNNPITTFIVSIIHRKHKKADPCLSLFNSQHSIFILIPTSRFSHSYSDPYHNRLHKQQSLIRTKSEPKTPAAGNGSDSNHLLCPCHVVNKLQKLQVGTSETNFTSDETMAMFCWPNIWTGKLRRSTI